MIRHAVTWMGFAMLAALLTGCGDDGTTTDAGAQEPAAPTQPQAKLFPVVTGSCPGFADGDGCTKDDVSLICTFQPEGVVKPRKVRVWFDGSAGNDERPLVFFFHGLGGMASNAVAAGAGLGATADEIVASGAILIALEKEDGRTTSLTSLPWIAGLGVGKDDDFLVMDEVVACADEALGVDHTRIHATGMSAGGLQTGQVVVKRSAYIASAVLFSGGISGKPKVQDASNKLPVAVFHGGPSDIVQPLMFEEQATNARTWLEDHDQFSILCNHDMGHSVPETAAAAGWRFLQDHPYGSVPSPYAKSVPSDFPADYCEL